MNEEEIITLLNKNIIGIEFTDEDVCIGEAYDIDNGLACHVTFNETENGKIASEFFLNDHMEVVANSNSNHVKVEQYTWEGKAYFEIYNNTLSGQKEHINRLVKERTGCNHDDVESMIYDFQTNKHDYPALTVEFLESDNPYELKYDVEWQKDNSIKRTRYSLKLKDVFQLLKDSTFGSGSLEEEFFYKELETEIDIEHSDEQIKESLHSAIHWMRDILKTTTKESDIKEELENILGIKLIGEFNIE